METTKNYSFEQVESIEKVLRLIHAKTSRQGREFLRHFTITPPQFSALVRLDEEGDMTISELSQKLYLACSTITDLIDRMEKNQLVERVRSSRDRRGVEVHIF